MPEPPARPKVLGFMNADELKKLPTSIYRIKKTSSTSEDTFTSPNATTNSSNAPNIVPVLNENQSNMTPSGGTHYLEPESKTTTLVQIQPIQSSPARGHPECEICLSELKVNYVISFILICRTEKALFSYGISFSNLT